MSVQSFKFSLVLQNFYSACVSGLLFNSFAEQSLKGGPSYSSSTSLSHISSSVYPLGVDAPWLKLHRLRLIYLVGKLVREPRCFELSIALLIRGSLPQLGQIDLGPHISKHEMSAWVGINVYGSLFNGRLNVMAGVWNSCLSGSSDALRTFRV